MSDPRVPHEPPGARQRSGEIGAGTWALGGLLGLLVVLGLAFAMIGRTGPDQSTGIERPAVQRDATDTTVPPGQSRAPETTGSR